MGGAKKDFWKDMPHWVTGTDNYYRSERELFRPTLERAFEEGLLYGSDDELILRLGLDPSSDWHKRFVALLRAREETIPGRQLVRLRESTEEAEEYRRIRITLQPGLALPRYRLRVYLPARYKARLAWEPAS
jgi:hypothetical protein